MDELHRRVARRIRETAKSRGVMLTHLPDFAGVGASHFFAVLRGASSPTLTWLGQIARALDVDASELLERPARGLQRQRRQ